MKNRDFTRAFGSPDAQFADAVETTLRRLMKEEERPVKKLRIGVAIAIAACLLLTAAFAAANHWGLIDFVNNAADISILPEATDLVATGIVQEGGETEYATFSLREAVYDGQYAYMLFDVKPKEGIMLLGVDSDPEYPMSELTNEPSDMTIEEYAQANNLKMVYTNIGGGGFNEMSLDFHMEDDGTLVYGIRGPAPKSIGKQLAVSVRCITYPADYKDFDMDVREALLFFTLESENAAVLGESASAADFPHCGVRVDTVRLQATPMGLYYRISYTVTDQAAFDAVEDGLWFEFLGEDGERMAGGATAGGAVYETEGGYMQSDSVAAVKELPASITLRAYSAWTKDLYDVAEIAIAPVE